jgi:hypothetical protein
VSDLYNIPFCGDIKLIDASETRELVRDPLGTVLMFEPPQPGATYFMGVDPSRGIVGWDRRLKKTDDNKIDNGVIQILRAGRSGHPDVQAAEYAAPIDAEDLGDVANAMGRLYAGNNEDGQALAIIEVWPGPGEPTQRRMVTKYGYTNLYTPIRYANTLTPERGRNTVGWVSNERSRRDLWTRGMKHIIQRKIRINSPFTIEEMADCQADDWMWTETARAKFGKHDDRVVALLLAIYAAHDWQWEDIDTMKVEVSEGGPRNWQAMDITAEGLFDAWEERFAQILDSD